MGAPPTLDEAVNPVLKGRLAVITGAGQGIGRVFAKALAMAGATIIIAEKNETKGSAVAAEVRALGGEADSIVTDVASEASIAQLFEEIDRRHGRADILINNAAIFSTLEMKPFEEISLTEWNSVLQVNLTGPFLCARAAVPRMRKAGFGRIVNMGSGAVALGRPNYLHYIATKSALVGMTSSMARELGSTGITVNAILPGATFTEIERKTVTPAQKTAIVGMQCIPRPQVPEDLVATLLYLTGPASSFVTGQAINVDGGATHR
jgi:3-oxoacyl-[acyl-carrier protein] reductase